MPAAPRGMNSRREGAGSGAGWRRPGRPEPLHRRPAPGPTATRQAASDRWRSIDPAPRPHPRRARDRRTTSRAIRAPPGGIVADRGSRLRSFSACTPAQRDTVEPRPVRRSHVLHDAAWAARDPRVATRTQPVAAERPWLAVQPRPSALIPRRISSPCFRPARTVNRARGRTVGAEHGDEVAVFRRRGHRQRTPPLRTSSARPATRGPWTASGDRFAEHSPLTHGPVVDARSPRPSNSPCRRRTRASRLGIAAGSPRRGPPRTGHSSTSSIRWSAPRRPTIGIRSAASRSRAPRTFAPCPPAAPFPGFSDAGLQ